jgi:hypothetical protein
MTYDEIFERDKKIDMLLCSRTMVAYHIYNMGFIAAYFNGEEYEFCNADGNWVSSTELERCYFEENLYTCELARSTKIIVLIGELIVEQTKRLGKTIYGPPLIDPIYFGT